ncbi:hypothetical protein, partial [Stutzerimonas stutzeri]|uniref:hypothetical protein n=1 Tax=Stutzerimonas stutzeri TaxID=316 RepID=UPI00265CAF10
MNRSIVPHPEGTGHAREASESPLFTGMARSHKDHCISPAALQTAFTPVGAGRAREASGLSSFTGMARSHKGHCISPAALWAAF